MRKTHASPDPSRGRSSSSTTWNRLHLGIAQAALILGASRQSLSKIVHGHRAVTPEMALRLGKAFCTTPELWLNLQRAYELWHAARQSDGWRHVQELVTASERTA